MPKAPPFSTSDEEEKTAIESGFEEEASTTVEQGDSADKLRALQLGRDQAKRPNTNITGTTNGGSVSDEPTVDDQRGAAALAMLPPPAVARLVITQGNDAGQSIEVRPGKTYTIGRGIDNDLVLTDIAVSRKHFDIRHENGSWVLADRGSGNGTLVNHRIEDAPFMLASGDVIEIGNTSFRFDVPNGAPRGPSSYDVPVDDDLELSTMSGRQIPGESGVATPHQLITPLAAPGLPPLAPLSAMSRPPVATPGGPPIAPAVPSLVASPPRPPGAVSAMAPGMSPASRPKTLPPPAPLPPPTPPGSMPRPRTQSSRPPPGYALDRPGGQPLPSLAAALAPTMSPMQGMPALQPPQPGTTLPLPQMANRAPLAPAVLLDHPMGSPAGGPQPTTLPGQGPPIQQAHPSHPAHPAHPARLPFSYPSAADLQQQSVPISTRNAAAMGPVSTRNAVVVTSGQPVRDATSTALVQPMSYANGQPAMLAAQQGYRSTSALSRRTKLIIGGAGLALVAAVATIAVIKGSSSSDPTLDKTLEKTSDSPPPKSAPPKPLVEPIRDPKAVKSIAPSTPPRADKDKTGDKTGAPLGTQPVLPGTDKVATATPPSTATPSTATPATATPSTATPASTATPSTATPAIAATPSTATPSSASSTAATPRTDKIAATPTPPDSTPSTTVAPKTDKVEVAATTQPRNDPARNDPARNDKRTPKRGDKRTDKVDRNDRNDKKTPPRTEIAASSSRSDKAEVASNTPKTDKKRGGRSTQDVKNSADALYRAKRFSDASALVTAALPSFSGADSQELKTIAAIYSQLGKDYNVGMAPGTKATDAYLALRRARNFDHDVGSAYVPEIEHVLVNVAAKAALSYAAAKEYEMAFQAVRQSEALGSTSPTNKSVRDKLEEVAAELYRSASSEMATDPESAKKKARQIQGMVDQKSPLYAKAAKLLNGS